MICAGLTREQSNELYLQVLQDNDTEALRRLTREDLFFLLTIGCKRKDIDRDWLYDRCREVEKSPNGYLDLWAREHYKALDINTPVWTTKGWKNHGDLKFGDYVFSPDGKPVMVIANTGVMNGADCFKIGEVVAAGEHLWPKQIKHKFRIKNGRKASYSTKIVSTREMIKARLPNITPLAGRNEKLPIHPYALGVWLGDGHAGCSRISSGYLDADEMTNLLNATGINVTRRDYEKQVFLSLGTGVRGDKSSSDFKNALRKLGIDKLKSVPSKYLLSSATNRLHLLRGLMDTDGHVEIRGTATFVNTNENLVDAVLFLARSFGVRAKKRRYENGGKGFWQVSFQALSGELCPFSLSRKVKRCKPRPYNMRQYTKVKVESRPVNCIQVDGGLYLAGKELLPTHNSTIITFGKSIQDILKDPDNTLIGIFSHTRGIAKGFLDQIKRELEGNSFLKDLFPDVLYKKPEVEAPKWSLDNGIIVKRKTNPKESTVEAWGLVDGQPTSKHFTVLVYDDVVTLESVTTTEQIRKTTASWEMSQNLGASGGVVRYIGTRYHANDTYKTMMDRGSVVKRIYPATENGKEDGVPVFLDRDTLIKKRRDQGPYTFATQMLQNPVADKSMGFKEEWLKFYETLKDTKGWNKYIVVDPSSGRKKTSGDYTVMEVIGLAPDGNYYLIDAVRDRMNLTERTKKLFQLHRKHKPKEVGYEQYGMQSDIEHIKFVMEQDNYRFNIKELGGGVAKEDRIKKLIPIYEQGRFYMPKQLFFVDTKGVAHDYVNIFIEDEYNMFPVSTHDDMFDCRARILEADLNAIFPKPEEPANHEDYHGGGSSEHGWMG